MELKDLGVSPQLPKIFWKKFSKTFIKTQLHCVFRDKISIALILKRKSCICCRKHCRAYFRRHMECAVLKRFLKVQGTFSIKSSCKSHFSIWKKLNLIRFIKTLIKGFTPHPLRSTPSPQGEGFKTLPSNLRFATFPFRDGFRFGKAPMKGELSRSDWGVSVHCPLATDC